MFGNLNVYCTWIGPDRDAVGVLYNLDETNWVYALNTPIFFFLLVVCALATLLPYGCFGKDMYNFLLWSLCKCNLKLWCRIRDVILCTPARASFKCTYDEMHYTTILYLVAKYLVPGKYY